MAVGAASLLSVACAPATAVANAASQAGSSSTTRISQAADGTQGNGHSYLGGISANGRYVTYYSVASNLVPGDTNGVSDVFLHDRWTRRTTRISVASDGTQGDRDSVGPAISGDGRYITYTSYATNLVPGDTNSGDWQSPGDFARGTDVFVYDRRTRCTTRVSVSSNGTQTRGDSGSPTISGDGRYVTYLSGASNLVPGDTNGQWDVFLHDRWTRRTTRVSVASDGRQANSASYGARLSANGRYVTYYSGASNLVAGDTNNDSDVFLYDRWTRRTTLVSATSDGAAHGNDGSSTGAISGDGRYITYWSTASNLVPGDTTAADVFLYDRWTRRTTLVSTVGDRTPGRSSAYPAISADGRYVTYYSGAWDPVHGAAYNVVRYDRWTRHTTPIAIASYGTQASGYSFNPEISANGRYITYVWDPPGLKPGETNGQFDVFLYRHW
jgi:hypothetical protein